MKHNFAIFGFFRLLFFSLALSSFAGCAQYKVATTKFAPPPPPPGADCVACENHRLASGALRHWLYQAVPRHRSQIRWYDLGHWTAWLLFGNDDDGLFGEAQSHPYKAHRKNSVDKALCWWLRNPLHNFCFYCIGSAHRKNSKFTLLQVDRQGLAVLRYRPVAKNAFGGPSTSLLLALHGGKPYAALRVCYSRNSQGQFYLGWRERGNFGIKFQPWKANRKKGDLTPSQRTATQLE